jgi:hypothetical protein
MTSTRSGVTFPLSISFSKKVFAVEKRKASFCVGEAIEKKDSQRKHKGERKKRKGTKTKKPMHTA